MYRKAPRIARILTCAVAAPALLVVAGCSSDSGSGSGADGGKKDSGAAQEQQKKPSAPPTVAAAKFASLPDACKALKKDTIEDLVPEADKVEGKADDSSNPQTRRGCSWGGLDDKGVKGSQYHYLTYSLQLFESNQALGSGEKRATEYVTKQVNKVQGKEGVKDVRANPAEGIGEQASTIGYGAREAGTDFNHAVVVARTGNVVVTLDYNGAGYAGTKAPDPADLLKGAQSAAKEVVASIGAANKQ
ncbi:hypothetical protein GCM10010329_08500 [Streptomyces spiroverticillatus]|uniref:DUF3558 domain-containing protein n=1 Tax=Streptomyces finlayi TaxID=67296 RepID=A0A918WTM1_9ACTN|nr:DUF3558 family protein [Streptomyces finlayi]GGZ90169.1 hypothetical protein GCM10010329_08500 [Streptomyces spiroverticillatus]GHC81026.1 hypothetical protein GCM10010334_08490 [Streptomyces finlayi]